MVLTPEEEAISVAFRRPAQLPPDDCLQGLQPTIPQLTRSSLHRCPERPVSFPRDRAVPDGISRLPEIEGDKPAKKRLADYTLGYFRIDLAEVSTKEGKRRLFVAISRQQTADPISRGSPAELSMGQLAREATAPASSPSFGWSRVRARWKPHSSCAT